MPSPVYYFVSLRLLMHENRKTQTYNQAFRSQLVVATSLFIYIVLRCMCGSVVQGTVAITAVSDFTQTDSTISCNKNFSLTLYWAAIRPVMIVPVTTRQQREPICTKNRETDMKKSDQ
jgi:hypothetical protein